MSPEVAQSQQNSPTNPFNQPVKSYNITLQDRIDLCAEALAHKETIDYVTKLMATNLGDDGEFRNFVNWCWEGFQINDTELYEARKIACCCNSNPSFPNDCLCCRKECVSPPFTVRMDAEEYCSKECTAKYFHSSTEDLQSSGNKCIRTYNLAP